MPSLSLSLPYRQLSDSCQKVLFSATYSDDVMSFAKQVVPDPIIIRLKRNEESLDNIKQVQFWCVRPQEMINYLSGWFDNYVTLWHLLDVCPSQYPLGSTHILIIIDITIFLFISFMWSVRDRRRSSLPCVLSMELSPLVKLWSSVMWVLTGNDGTCVASYTHTGFHTEAGAP